MVNSSENSFSNAGAGIPIRHFPSEAEQIVTLVQRLDKLVARGRAAGSLTTSSSSRTPLIVRAPLRVSPLGAHIDHQLGTVTGFTIDQSILMAFLPTEDASVHIESLNFERPVTFATDSVPAFRQGEWANYARGAVLALCERYQVNHGLVGVIGGSMPIGGLSSSAAVTLAYLLAFQAANHLAVDEADNVEHCRYTENKYIGLNNGILDQSVILYSAPNHLTCIDCHGLDVQRVPFGVQGATGTQPPEPEHNLTRPVSSRPPSPSVPYEVLVVYSGITRGLTGTDYNNRVAECQLAAQQLLKKAGKDVPQTARLRHVSTELYQRYRDELVPPLQRRADHFFGEMQRVHDGIRAWTKGDVVQFGSLMNESGASSITLYECGSPHLITLYEVLSATPGVYGTRFSGAGFRGNCIALIDPARRDQIAASIHSQFPHTHPDVADKYSIHFCQTAGPATLIDAASPGAEPYNTVDRRA